MLLEKEIAIITGAGQGIGRTVAKTFASQGAKVIVADLNYKNALSVTDEIKKEYNTDALAIEVDISNSDSVNKMIENSLNKFNTIDILVNNAGICQSSVPFEELSTNDWQKMINVNLMGTINCAKAVIPIMKKNKHGKIISLSSLAGEVGGISVAANYSTTKAGIAALTKSLAKYLGPFNINVNAVAPGFIKTDMTKDLEQNVDLIPLRRLGETEEIADVILFLASRLSRYITGSTIDINGGIFMK